MSSLKVTIVSPGSRVYKTLPHDDNVDNFVEHMAFVVREAVAAASAVLAFEIFATCLSEHFRESSGVCGDEQRAIEVAVVTYLNAMADWRSR